MKSAAPAKSPEAVERNARLAGRFLDALRDLPAETRGQISTSEFGTAAHTGAMLAVADEITLLRQRDPEERVGEFLVNAEQRISELQLSPEVDALAKAAARALLVHDLPGLESTTRTLYGPFEPVIPLNTLSA